MFILYLNRLYTVLYTETRQSHWTFESHSANFCSSHLRGVSPSSTTGVEPATFNIEPKYSASNHYLWPVNSYYLRFLSTDHDNEPGFSTHFFLNSYDDAGHFIKKLFHCCHHAFASADQYAENLPTACLSTEEQWLLFLGVHHTNVHTRI